MFRGSDILDPQDPDLKDFATVFKNSSLRVTEGQASRKLGEACQSSFCRKAEDALENRFKVGPALDGAGAWDPVLAKGSLAPAFFGMVGHHCSVAKFEAAMAPMMKYISTGTVLVSMWVPRALVFPSEVSGSSAEGAMMTSDFQAAALKATEEDIKAREEVVSNWRRFVSFLAAPLHQRLLSFSPPSSWPFPALLRLISALFLAVLRSLLAAFAADIKLCASARGLFKASFFSRMSFCDRQPWKSPMFCRSMMVTMDIHEGHGGARPMAMRSSGVVCASEAALLTPRSVRALATPALFYWAMRMPSLSARLSKIAESHSSLLPKTFISAL